MSERQPRVGIAHPLMMRGGSEAAVMWAIQALKPDHDVSLITAGAVELSELNGFYGTDVRPSDFQVLRHPLSVLIGAISRAAAVRGALHGRFCRRVATSFDVVINAYNVGDFGVPAIHIIADLSWDAELRTQHDPAPRGWARVFYGDTPLRRIYLGITKLLAGSSGRDVFAGDDLLLANSHWTAHVLSRRCGVQAHVLYPPVTDKFPAVPFDEKENGFVFIGRVSPEKRIEDIIDILSRVRALGHDIHLHLVGPVDSSPYGKRVQASCRQHRDWIVPEGQLFGQEKARLLTSHRFGINARVGEAFGISVAEMVKAGAIAFVHCEGGQAEIVNHPLLTYCSPDDAVVKIDRVLHELELQHSLCRHLAERGRAFSVEGFMTGLRAAVAQFLREMKAREALM